MAQTDLDLPPIYGLTGNIGSGKTTVAGQFEILGVPVYYADTAAKRLMREDGQLREGLIRRFGASTYLEDGSLNRPHLAGLAFNDAVALNDLNALVHPAVHRDAAHWRRRHSTAHFTLYEAAILLEIGRRNDFHGIITVHAPEAERRARVMRRDGSTAEQFAARAAKQWPDQQKLEAGDFVIDNSGRALIFPQVLRVYSALVL